MNRSEPPGIERNAPTSGGCHSTDARVLAAAETAGQIAADRRVIVDLLCAGCRYNLRTLAVDTVCPECATPVIRTLVERAGPPADYLRAVCRGIGGMACGLVLFLSGVLLIASGSIFASARDPTVALGALGTMSSVVGICLALLSPIGITEAVSDWSEVSEGLNGHRLGRLGLLSILVAITCLIVAAATHAPDGNSVWPLLFVYFASVAFLLGVAFIWVGTFWHIRFLLRRIGADRLAVAVSLYGWVCLILDVAGLAVLVAGIAGFHLPLSWRDAAAGLPTLALVTAIALALAGLLLLVAARRILRRFTG